MVRGGETYFALPSQVCSVLPPRRGTDKPAQGNALGIEFAWLGKPWKGGTTEVQACFALSGLVPRQG